MFGPIWFCLVLFGPVCPFLPCSAPFGTLLTRFNTIQSSLTPFYPSLPLSSTYEPHFSIFNLFGPVLLCLAQIGTFFMMASLTVLCNLKLNRMVISHCLKLKNVLYTTTTHNLYTHFSTGSMVIEMVYASPQKSNEPFMIKRSLSCNLVIIEK